MSETNGSVNGRARLPNPNEDFELLGDPRQDFDLAARMLYHELRSFPWFSGLERDEEGRSLIVEAKDMVAAGAWYTSNWHGWSVEVKRSKALAFRGAVS